GVARENVDLAGLQGREALLRIERHEVDLLRIAQHGRGNGAAGIDVQARPVALCVGGRETGHAVGHAALDGAALLDRVERLAGKGRGRGGQRENAGGGQKCRAQSGGWVVWFFHDRSVLLNSRRKAVYGATRTDDKEP